MTSSLRMSPADLGNTSAVLDESKDDVDRAEETVGPSFGPLLVLLDVRPEWTDDLNPFSPVLEGFRNCVPQSSPVLDRLQEDVGKFSDHVKPLRDDVKQSRDHVKQSRDDVEKSSHYLNESSEQRSRPRSSSSGPQEARERLLHRRQEGGAHVDEDRASSSGLESVVS